MTDTQLSPSSLTAVLTDAMLCDAGRARLVARFQSELKTCAERIEHSMQIELALRELVHDNPTVH